MDVQRQTRNGSAVEVGFLIAAGVAIYPFREKKTADARELAAYSSQIN